MVNAVLHFQLSLKLPLRKKTFKFRELAFRKIILVASPQGRIYLDIRHFTIKRGVRSNIAIQCQTQRC